jgi:hypothetical protein
MPSWRTLAPALVVYALLSPTDWASTSAGVAGGWLRLNGTGVHEGSPLTAWLYLHGGVRLALAWRVAVFILALALVSFIRSYRTQTARWLLWSAPSVALSVQAWATWSSVAALLAHGN